VKRPNHRQIVRDLLRTGPDTLDRLTAAFFSHPDLLAGDVMATMQREYVRRLLRSRSGEDQLPFALAVKPNTYKPLAMFDVADYTVAIRRYASQGERSMQLALALAQACQSRHHVWIEPTGLFGEDTGT